MAVFGANDFAVVEGQKRDGVGEGEFVESFDDREDRLAQQNRAGVVKALQGRRAWF